MRSVVRQCRIQSRTLCAKLQIGFFHVLHRKRHELRNILAILVILENYLPRATSILSQIIERTESRTVDINKQTQKETDHGTEFFISSFE